MEHQQIFAVVEIDLGCGGVAEEIGHDSGNRFRFGGRSAIIVPLQLCGALRGLLVECHRHAAAFVMVGTDFAAKEFRAR